MWMLGIEPGSSRRAYSALNHRAISSSPGLLLLSTSKIEKKIGKNKERKRMVGKGERRKGGTQGPGCSSRERNCSAGTRLWVPHGSVKETK